MADAFRRCEGVDGFDFPLERHICASMPSIWRNPLRIFCVSFDAMLSKASESSASISSPAGMEALERMFVQPMRLK
jgi:hypothetical protein